MKTIKNITVGSIFAESYGCNANQTAFYQVVHSTTHFVDVRRIGATVGEQLEGDLLQKFSFTNRGESVILIIS